MKCTTGSSRTIFSFALIEYRQPEVLLLEGLYIEIF
jgi:hypothetical protein